MGIRYKRFIVSSIISGIFISLLSFLTEGVLLKNSYQQAIQNGTILKEPRIPLIIYTYGLSLFVVAFVINFIYALIIKGKSSDFKASLLVGFLIGFCVAFPINYSTIAWMPMEPSLSFWVMGYLWIGSIGAGIIAYFLYRNKY